MQNNFKKNLLAVAICLVSSASLASANPNPSNSSYSFDINSGANNGNQTQLLVCSYVDSQGQVDNHIKVADNGHWARYRSSHPFTPFDATFISTESYQSIVNKCESRAIPGDKLINISTVGELALSPFVNNVGLSASQASGLKKVMFNHDVYFSEVGRQNIYPFKRVIFLGDSLSDNSDDFRYYMYIMQKAFPGRYWDMRFSNGLMWDDWLTSNNQTTNGTGMNLPKENFAWGGAYAFTNRSGIIPSLITQVGTYLDFIESNNLTADEGNTLYSILAGGNDFMSTNHTPAEVAAVVTFQMERLIESARSNNISTVYFLMPTLPDVSIVPNQASSPNKTVMHENVLKYNSLMTKSISLLQIRYALMRNNPIKVVVFRPDFFKDLNDLISLAQNPQNKLNVTHACMVANSKGVTVCDNPQGTIFWDGLHPNATAGCMLGQNITHYIDQNLNLPFSYFKTDFDSNFIKECSYTYIQPLVATGS